MAISQKESSLFYAIFEVNCTEALRQKFTAAVQEHADPDLIGVENPGSFRNGKALCVAQPEGFVLVGFKHLGQFPERKLLVLLLEENGRIIEINFLVPGKFLEASGAAKMIEGGPFGDGKQPGAEGLRAIETMNVLVNFEEGFLREILGVMRISGNWQRK